MKRLVGCAVAILLGAIGTMVGAWAQPYPVKPVRVIVVFPPGGSIDITGRIVFARMPDVTGQQFVLENRGGAGGTIGSELVARSPADGYTLMIQSTTHVANAHLYKKLSYDVLKDFIGVTTLARQVGVLVVHPSLPAKSVKELIALAKQRPGDISYGASGNGSYAHMSMALFVSMSGTRMLTVQYKGAGPGNVALIAGETQAMLTTLGSIAPAIKAGQVRALGVSSDSRSAQFPTIPTIGESLPGYEFTGWVGCFVPAGTPRAIVDTLNAALKKALEFPDVASKLTDLTLDPMHMTPEQFAQRLQADYAKYAKVVKLSGARIE
jgi:tripartite-type tricarboxylate transporter receptor subunit TctC